MSEPPKFRAGWYPDARNPGYQRYWDGTAWTPHIAHLQGAAAPAKAGRGWKIAVALVLVAVFSAAGVVLATREDHATPVRHATTNADALGLARRAQVVPGDLPTGWTECCRPEVFQPTQLRELICGSDPSLPPHDAGYQRQYALNLQPDDSEEGHLVSTAVVSTDSKTAEREFAAVTAPAYQLCAFKNVEQEALAGAPSGLGPPSTTSARRSVDGVQGVLDSYVTKYSTPAGAAVVYTARLRIVVGRVLIRVNVQSHVAPTSSATISAIAKAVDERARKGQPGLPSS